MRLARRVTLLAAVAALLLALGPRAPRPTPCVRAAPRSRSGSTSTSTSTNVVMHRTLPQPGDVRELPGIATTVTLNNVAGVPARADLDNWTFAGGMLPGGAACGVFVNAAPGHAGLANGLPESALDSRGRPTRTARRSRAGGLRAPTSAPPRSRRRDITRNGRTAPSMITPAIVQFVNAPLADVAGACPVVRPSIGATRPPPTP